jgi:hypothetical protein
VFTPRPARGENGVMLTEYLGVGCIGEINIRMSERGGYTYDIAWYPICPPINDSVVHDEAGSMMIGRQWRIYRTVRPEKKWSILSTFNVMQFFFYNSS